MQDARYLRSQAEMCLRLARQLSPRSEAEALRLLAAEYYERADKLDEDQGTAPNFGRAEA